MMGVGARWPKREPLDLELESRESGESAGRTIAYNAWFRRLQGSDPTGESDEHLRTSYPIYVI